MTTEQQSIIELPLGARLLVTAGPGTGKTHVLIGRLAHLLQAYKLRPGAEIAVLTFSRSAVREIRERAAKAGGDVGYVRAATFDSFATRLLAECLPEGAWSMRNYDGRIQAAIELIAADASAKHQIQAYAHVFVDELQDLVGVRAELVKTIVENVAGGFTLLGDPAQGIYNFHLDGPARTEGSSELYRWLRKRFHGGLTEASLTRNHRAQTKVAETALWAGPLLNGLKPDYETIKEKLTTSMLKLPFLGTLETACASFKTLPTRTTILCRTNGQSLIISRRLHESGVAHTLQRRAIDRVLPSWIALLFVGHQHRQIGRQAFLERGEKILGAERAQVAWTVLLRALGARGLTLDVSLLAERIRSGNVPDEMLDSSDTRLIVSTIHRAKGLEFDRVILATDDEDFTTETSDELAEETRLLYVALTRPKMELQHMQLPEFKGLFECKRANRWIRKRGWKISDVEVRGEDVHQDDPAGGFLLKNCDPVGTQQYLAKSVRSGEPVVLTRLKVSAGGEPRAFYLIEHNTKPIGTTSDSFGAVLFSTLKLNKSWEVNWPTRIDSLWIECLDTVAGSEASGRKCGLGASGLWLRARIAGLGQLVFEKKQG